MDESRKTTNCSPNHTLHKPSVDSNSYVDENDNPQKSEKLTKFCVEEDLGCDEDIYRQTQLSDDAKSETLQNNFEDFESFEDYEDYETDYDEFDHSNTIFIDENAALELYETYRRGETLVISPKLLKEPREVVASNLSLHLAEYQKCHLLKQEGSEILQSREKQTDNNLCEVDLKGYHDQASKLSQPDAPFDILDLMAPHNSFDVLHLRNHDSSAYEGSYYSDTQLNTKAENKLKNQPGTLLDQNKKILSHGGNFRTFHPAVHINLPVYSPLCVVNFDHSCGESKCNSHITKIQTTVLQKDISINSQDKLISEYVKLSEQTYSSFHLLKIPTISQLYR